LAKEHERMSASMNRPRVPCSISQRIRVAPAVSRVRQQRVSDTQPLAGLYATDALRLPALHGAADLADVTSLVTQAPGEQAHARGQADPRYRETATRADLRPLRSL